MIDGLIAIWEAELLQAQHTAEENRIAYMEDGCEYEVDVTYDDYCEESDNWEDYTIATLQALRKMRCLPEDEDIWF